MAFLFIATFLLLLSANGISNIAAPKCMDAIPRKSRDSIGAKLCGNDNRTFPAMCYLNLSTLLIDLKVDMDFLINFCKLPFKNEDASLVCLKATLEVSSQSKYRISKETRKDSLVSIAEICQDAVLTKPTEQCIKEMIDIAPPSKSKAKEATLKDLVSYCASSGEQLSITDAEYDDMELDNSFIFNSKLKSSLSYCYNSSKHLKIGSTGKLLTSLQKIDLCKNTPIGQYKNLNSGSVSPTTSSSLGPVACVELFLTQAPKPLHKSVPIDVIINTCNQANDPTGPVECMIFAYSRPNRKPNDALIRELCQQSPGKV